MFVRRVVRYDIDDYLDTGPMRGRSHRIEVIHGTEAWIHVAIVDHVVAAVGQIGWIERRQPDRIDAQLLQIIHLFGDTGDVAQSVAVHILETARINLVDHRLLPPIVTLIVCSHT